MCEPVSIGLGILSTASQVASQKAAAKAQRIAQERASAAEQRRVQQQYTSMRAQEAAEQRAAARELQAAQVASFEAYGEAAAIDKGIGGNSVQAIQNSYLQALGNTRSSIYQQMAENEIARNFGFESVGLQSTMNQIGINKPIAQPDYLGSAIGGVTTGLSAHSAMGKAGLLGGAPTDALASTAKVASSAPSGGFGSLIPSAPKLKIFND